MTRNEKAVYVMFVVLIVIWAVLGPGGWASGLVGAAVGVALAVAFVLAGRARARR